MDFKNLKMRKQTALKEININQQFVDLKHTLSMTAMIALLSPVTIMANISIRNIAGLTIINPWK